MAKDRTNVSDNPKMNRPCTQLDKELTKLYQCIEENLSFDTDASTRFIPYENHDKAKKVQEFIRWMSRTYKNFLRSGLDVWKLCAHVNRQIEKIDNELDRKQHQISLFSEEDVRKEIDDLQLEKRKLEFVRGVCHQGAFRFEYLFHVKG